MRRVFWVALLVMAAMATITTSAAARPTTVEFKRAELRVEINATDGDAGLQIDLDHEPWRSISLRTPDRRVVFDVTNTGVLRDYGLTELFSESSEPPFTEFPLDEFKALFPEGTYVFTGTQVDGTRMRSTVHLTHDFPAGPDILAPEEGATIPAEGLVVEWGSGEQPAGIDIVAYQVLVVADDGSSRTLSMEVGADTTSIAVPSEFLAGGGDYKVEVLAIEQSGNQTLTETTFTVE